MEKIIRLDTIKDYNDFLGIPTPHTLVSVINASLIKPLHHVRKSIGFYVVYLKDIKCAQTAHHRHTNCCLYCRPTAFIAQLLRRHGAQGDKSLGTGISATKDAQHGKKPAHHVEQEHNGDSLLLGLSISTILHSRFQEPRRLYAKRISGSGEMKHVGHI